VVRHDRILEQVGADVHDPVVTGLPNAACAAANIAPTSSASVTSARIL
jgi:hypothetical protein